MSRPATPPPVCDGPGCGKQKGVSNHWWLIGVDPEGFMLVVIQADRYGPPEAEDDFHISTWFDFCGQTCALKFISEQMGKVQNDGKS